MSPRVLGARAGDVEDDDFDDFNRASGYSRPRTKTRPNYGKAPVGRVLGVDRGRFDVAVGPLRVRAIKARPLGRKSVVVGDEVRLMGDTSGAPDALSRIVEVLPRRTLLRRSADDDDPTERPLVANTDQLLIVTAAADPPPRIGMIDRLIVAASVAGVRPLIVVTKTDLASPDDIATAYQDLATPSSAPLPPPSAPLPPPSAPLPPPSAPPTPSSCAQSQDLGIAVVATYRGCDLAPLRQLLEGHTTVLVGHSGVGKSTLINALIPGAGRSIGHVNDVTGKGRHTSTTAVALALDEQSWVIDTPGVRSFGLAGVTPDQVVTALGDVAEIVADCPRGCPHLADSLDCALDAAVEDGRLTAARLASLRRMLTVLTRPDW